MPKPLNQKKQKKPEKENKNSLQSPKGMRDILPSEQPLWEKVKKASQDTAGFYNFLRIDTPILEKTEVFERGVGVSTDIVEKEMFNVKTKGGDRLVLRPENTAGIVRAYFENGMSRMPQPTKLYYFGPFFRYEQPQAGRYRQFHQYGFEILGGEDDPVYDAQIILAGIRSLEELKIKNLSLQINSVGCRNCRQVYRRKLQEYYRRFSGKVCKDCKRRVSINPLRLLDCKNEKCLPIKEDAPAMINYLCAPCRSHFREVLEYLDSLSVSYSLNNFLVRGLDYYNRTVFEIYSESSLAALGGGGRYDYLAELLGVKKSGLPAVGASFGVERIIELMKTLEINGLVKPKAKVFLIQIGKPAKKKAFSLVEEFHKAGIKVIESLGKESLRAQLKVADKEGAEMALILGQREVFEESIIIRDMKSGVQETVPLTKVVDEVKKRI
ncbi:MAG: histidine--tRNA ligase [Candidatus Paceibacterota bacterium]